MRAEKQNLQQQLAELDAAAVLRKLQKDAAKFSNQVDDAEARLMELNQLSPNAIDAEENKKQICRVEMELAAASKNFRENAKILLGFDKGVSPEKREGEKIPVAEAKEIFQQLMLSISLAIEQIIISDAQSFALCDSPETFHVAHAENYRAAMQGALSSAKNEGVIPAWLV